MFNNLRTVQLQSGNDNIGAWLRNPWPLRQPIPRQWLVWEWLLNGNAWDSSGYGNNGTATNVTYSDTDVGYYRQCGVFNWSNSSIDTWNNFSSMFNGLFSVSLFVKCTNSAGSTYWSIFENQVNWGAGKEVTIRQTNNTNQFTVNFYDWSTSNLWFFSAITQNWNHIVLVRDSLSTAKVYLNWNSSPILSLNITNTNYTWPTNVFFWRYSTTQYFNWKLNFIRLYNRIISPNEIQTLYKEWLKLLH